VTFSLDAHWVWDFWLADDGEQYHLYYLHAPTSLGDQQLRHRNARVGHAVSRDLRDWTDLGPVLGPGAVGDPDETATWTGCIVRGADGLWRMFYTGSRFLSPDSTANIETVCLAVSTDLHEWTKRPAVTVEADPRWYETLGSSSWPEQAWRDPWVFADPQGNGWHMLVTARSKAGDELDRGVIGHATSSDLDDWQVQPPLSAPGAGFMHLEVPQQIAVDGSNLLLFSCDSPALAGARAGERGGVWMLPTDSPTAPYAAETATLLADDRLYAGRATRDRSGGWVLLAFENRTEDGGFAGVLSDPIALEWADGHLRLKESA
jgi:beta-fructofuranosidase